jgi:hypothetical protein
MEPTSSRHPSSSSPAPEGPVGDHDPCGCDCRAVLSLLERCEADPAFGRRDARTLAAHLERCAPCAARYGRRLSGAVGFVSLHERRVPTGLLDDLYAAVHARAPYAPLAGGMSETFLDGPRSLRLWRSTAAAAVLLLAVGASWVLSNGVGLTTRPESVPIGDPRDGLLQRRDVDDQDAGTDPRFTTVSWPQRRTQRLPFWGQVPNVAPVVPEAPRPRRN